jgi:hypothetical protein
MKILHLLAILTACSGQQVKYGVSITTIPPRYSTIHHVIRSWMEQSLVPDVIAVFVPQQYVNFMGESKRDKTRNALTLKSHLSKYFPTEVENGKIVIQLVTRDWGPITKYLGLFEHFSNIDGNNHIDYWVICDDDVRYSNNTLSDYSVRISSTGDRSSILTHFNTHARLRPKINGKYVNVMHLQGVDTVLFPSFSFAGSLSFPIASATVSLIHESCPHSFYQDDYVISLLVYLSKIRVQSVWSGKKVAYHVNGVSTSNQQMHIHPEVFEREEGTKECLVKIAEKVSGIVDRMRHEDMSQSDQEL